MTDPFVSVVTAVYNGEPYLEECIKSVLAQSHGDFEYIICNNHSKDRSGEIAADYASMDPRLRVISPPEFSTQAKNFNFAMQQISARSEYCKMIHADDWMFPQCLREMIDVAQANPRVVLVSAYRLVGDQPGCFGAPVERSSFSGSQACRWQLSGEMLPFGSQSTVMYRADVVRSRAPSFFPENRYFMDVDVAFLILKDADFGFVHQILTFSRDQPESITGSTINFNWWRLLQYTMVEQYGRALLTPAEFDARLREVTSELYKGMGTQWLMDRFGLRPRDGYWDFQRKNLGDIGVEIRRTRLAKGVVAALLSVLGSPAAFVKEARAGIRLLGGGETLQRRELDAVVRASGYGRGGGS